MRNFTNVLIFSCSLLLAGCLATSPVSTGPRIDEIPMYGGIDRSKNPELKVADENFIAEVTQHFGSREKASQIWVAQGFRFYQQDKLGMAMRRFNQAWLLNPSNPEVYAGFGSVLHDQGSNCEAMKMMDKALSLNPPSFQGIYPDAARIKTLCAVSNKTFTSQEKEALIEESEALYKKAEQVEPNKGYLYGSWATAYYWRGQYSDAWNMVAKQRAVGNTPNARFLELLKVKMSEPVRQ